MSGSLIVNSSRTGSNINGNSGSFSNQFDSIVTTDSTVTQETSDNSTDTFNPFQTIVGETNSNNQAADTPDSKIEQQKQDPQLTKILASSELIRLYELKLSGQTQDGNGKKVDDLIKSERDKIGVNNEDINKYIEYKRTLLESLGQSGDSAEKVAKALDTINALPEELKKSIDAKLREKLANSEAINRSTYNVEQILDGDYTEILKANPEIAKSISKSLKALSSDEAFSQSLENSTVVSDGDSFKSKLAWGGLGTAATAVTIGLVNSWNPVGWVLLGGTALTLAGAALTTESTRNSLRDFLGIFGKARIS